MFVYALVSSEMRLDAVNSPEAAHEHAKADFEDDYYILACKVMGAKGE